MGGQPTEQFWRVSPLMKLRLVFGMPWVFGIAVLFIGGLVAGIIKAVEPIHMATPALVIGAIVWAIALGLMGFGVEGAKRQIGILQHAAVAEAVIEDIVVTELQTERLREGSKLYVFKLGLIDDAGNEWKASYNAGVLGFDAEVGDRLPTVFDTRDDSKVVPLKYMEGRPTPGDDGVIRTGKQGEVIGFAVVGIVIAIGWIVVVLL